MSLFDEQIPTFIDKTGQWFQDFGNGVKESFGQFIDTSKQIYSGVEKLREVTGGKQTKELLAKQGLTPEESQKAIDLTSGLIGAVTPIKVLKTAPKIVSTVKKTKELGFIKSVSEELPNIKVAGQYVPRNTDTLSIKAKNYIQSNLNDAERIALTETNDRAVALGSQLLKRYSSEIESSSNNLVRNSLNDKAAKLATVMANNLMEQGRSIQAASILGRLTPEGQVRFAAQEIARYNTKVTQSKGGILGLQKKIPELTGDNANFILNEMKAIKDMPDGVEKAIKFNKLQDYISSLVPTPLYQKIVAIWKAGLLTGLKTSGLNILSNLSHAGLETVKDIPGSGVDSVVSFFTGKRTLTSTTRGLIKGNKEGFEKGWTYFKTGYSERNIPLKLDYKKVHFGKSLVGKTLQKYEQTVFRVLGSEDQPFYYGAKAKSLYSQAIAQAKNKRLKGNDFKNFVESLVKNPTDEMLKYAVKDAEMAVFQNETVLGKIASNIQKVPGGEFVVPFARTPSAVATQIINYSPIGIAKTIIENIGKGRFDQRLFSQGIGRGLTGTSILAIGAELYKNGLITLDRPTSEKERKLWELEGRKPNSINVDGSYRTVQVFGPAGNLILVGGQFQKALNELGSPTEAIIQALTGSAKAFTEQTFLTGVNQVISALNDPKRSASNFFKNFIASGVPTIVSDIARAQDPLERRAETILQKIESRIPGLRENLQPQIDVFGKEIQRIGNPLEVLADPTRPSEGHETAATMELRRLLNNGYNVTPSLLGDKTGYSVLNQQQNTDLWKRAGEITNEKLMSLFAKDAYFKMDDEQKAKTVESVIEKSQLVARVEKVIELTQNLQGQELINKLSELKKGGLMTKTIFKEYQRLR